MEKQRKYVPLQIVMLSIDSVGGEGNIHNVLAILREISGVRGAGLFFSNTTVRIYYDPECTDLGIIFATLLPLKVRFKDEAIHQDAFARAVVGR